MYALLLSLFAAAHIGQPLQRLDSFIEIRPAENTAISLIVIRVIGALSHRSHKRTVPVVDQHTLHTVRIIDPVYTAVILKHPIHHKCRIFHRIHNSSCGSRFQNTDPCAVAGIKAEQTASETAVVMNH